jgi:hypothetical protein
MKLPKSWQDISIGTFQQLHKLTEPTFENQIATLAVLTGQTVEQIEELPIREITDAIGKLSWMAELPTAKDFKKFRHGLTTYKFVASQHELAAHQFIAVQDLFGQADNWVGNLHKIMAALAVKYRFFRKSEIKPTEFDKVADLFRDRMSIANAYGYALFFSAYLPELLETTRQYLEQEVEKLRKIHAEKTAQQSHGSKQ